jgi:hypothetical protein
MRPWSRSDPVDDDVSGSAQFEGRTAEEAVARARAALGDAGALRCWKTRRGGVGGFFAKEVFVAGLTAPPGSEGTRGQKRAAPRRGRVSDGTVDGAAKTASAADPVLFDTLDTSAAPGDHLSGLVESTSDQVSLGPLAIPAEAFDEVLAEAQAALSREREGNGVAMSPGPQDPGPQTVATEEPGASECQPALPDDGQGGDPPRPHGNATAPRRSGPPEGKRRPARPAKKSIPPKARAGLPPPVPRSVRATAPAEHGRPARIQDLRPGLRRLGVPGQYVPPGRRPSLDQLAGVMATLPVPPALPSHAGAVVAIVGSDRNLNRTVELVTAELSVAQRDVLRFDGAQTEGPRPGRQIARRRAGSRTSLLALQAGPGLPLGRDVRTLLEQSAPDYVLAAVDAASKRADVEHWIGELPRVDALALWDLSGTRTPAELLGLLPIAFVDGEPSSPLGWTLALAGRAMDGRGR